MSESLGWENVVEIEELQRVVALYGNKQIGRAHV